MEEMNMKSVKIGFAPTRRSIFSAPDAVKYANLTRERLKDSALNLLISQTSMRRVCFTMRRTVRKSRRNSAVRT